MTKSRTVVYVFMGGRYVTLARERRLVCLPMRTRSGGASRTWPRAGFTQPERRIVSIEGDAAGIEVITTSQKLAHRVVNELKKAFGGRASYAWSDRDGSLFATWKRDDTPS